MKERIFAIDIARAISIMLVVFGHFIPENSPEWWYSIQDVLATFRMPLFMAVSGYTYLYLLRKREDKRKSYGSFIWLKFQRLMIPYFFISVFIISIKLIVGGGGAEENPVSLASFYEMFYSPAAAPFVWFVYVLFMVFLIIPFFNSHKKLTFVFAIALVLYFVPINLTNTLYYIYKFKSMLMFFVAGCIFYEWRNVRNSIINTHFLVFVVFFVLFYYGKYILTNNLMGSICSLVASLCGVILIIKIAKYISEKGKAQHIFLSIAACSYTIYLFHTTFQGFTKVIFSKLSLQQYIGYTSSFIIEAIMVISVGVIVPMVLHYIIVRKSKILSYLIGAKYKSKSV